MKPINLIIYETVSLCDGKPGYLEVFYWYNNEGC